MGAQALPGTRQNQGRVLTPRLALADGSCSRRSWIAWLLGGEHGKPSTEEAGCSQGWATLGTTRAGGEGVELPESQLLGLRARAPDR